MAKIFRKERFHSKELIPFNKGQEGLEDIEKVLIWIDVHQEIHRFKEGDEVCHSDNLAQKMFVATILKKTIEIPLNGDPKVKVKKTKMIGIECHWFEQR